MFFIFNSYIKHYNYAFISLFVVTETAFAYNCAVLFNRFGQP